MKGPMVWFGHKALPPCSGLAGWWCNIYEDDDGDDQNCDGEDETGCDQRSSNSVFFLQDYRSHPCHLAHTSRRQLPSSVGAFSKGMVGLLNISWYCHFSVCVCNLPILPIPIFLLNQLSSPFLVCSWWAPMGGLGPTPLQRRSPLHWHFEKTKTFLA